MLIIQEFYGKKCLFVEKMELISNLKADNIQKYTYQVWRYPVKPKWNCSPIGRMRTQSFSFPSCVAVKRLTDLLWVGRAQNMPAWLRRDSHLAYDSACNAELHAVRSVRVSDVSELSLLHLFLVIFSVNEFQKMACQLQKCSSGFQIVKVYFRHCDIHFKIVKMNFRLWM